MFYLNVWIWAVRPVEVMRNCEVQSAIAVVSRPQKANNNIIRFIFIFLFESYNNLLICKGTKQRRKMEETA